MIDPSLGSTFIIACGDKAAPLLIRLHGSSSNKSLQAMSNTGLYRSFSLKNVMSAYVGRIINHCYFSQASNLL